MAKKKKAEIFSSHSDCVKRIIAILERIHSADRYQSFRDFCEITEITLLMLPHHLKSARENGKMADDLSEYQERWKMAVARYRPDEIIHLCEAFRILLESVELGYGDVIGQVFMDFVGPKQSGIFFTPWNIALCMAEMTLGDISELIKSRMREAREKFYQHADDGRKLYMDALTIASLASDNSAGTMIDLYSMVAEYIEPITIHDPCVGSGVMLLAAASIIPQWAIDCGLVQFYGIDINPTCVQMTRINVLLYGLNGAHLSWYYEISLVDQEKLSGHLFERYARARTARDQGDLITEQQIESEMRQSLTGIAQSLFDLAPYIEESKKPNKKSTNNKKFVKETYQERMENI